MLRVTNTFVSCRCGTGYRRRSARVGPMAATPLVITVRPCASLTSADAPGAKAPIQATKRRRIRPAMIRDDP
ncbi:hypothetical protein GCM10023195_28280 [Actinoallomurus liliacearum]|uniref:Uncharacterized protein n=1 Tax=Actinoallomurus liliacearum TaxID=1080073 RepID=A0ABP8TIJ3_9ACTN